MIQCIFENNKKTSLRHVVTHAIVEKDKTLLCVKRAAFLPEGGKWALPGGFLDRDETAAEGVMRELLEETGWTSSHISVFRINTNPNRPHEDRQNVAIDFLLKPEQKVQSPDKETREVRWIPIREVQSYTFAFDHEESIELFLRYKKQPFTLPVFE